MGKVLDATQTFETRRRGASLSRYFTERTARRKAWEAELRRDPERWEAYLNSVHQECLRDLREDPLPEDLEPPAPDDGPPDDDLLEG